MSKKKREIRITTCEDGLAYLHRDDDLFLICADELEFVAKELLALSKQNKKIAKQRRKAFETLYGKK